YTSPPPSTHTPPSLRPSSTYLPLFFFFNDTAPTEIYTLSLHDALPISSSGRRLPATSGGSPGSTRRSSGARARSGRSTPASRCRSEEHTSELQSRSDLVCRLLLEKKKKKIDETKV